MEPFWSFLHETYIGLKEKSYKLEKLWQEILHRPSDMAIKRNGCRSLVRLSFRAPSNFGSKPEWMESSCRTGIFPSIHFLMFLSLMESFRLRCIKRSIDSIRISEKMVSTPPGQRLRTTRSPHQVIPLLLAATRLLIKGQAETFLNSGPIISLRN